MPKAMIVAVDDDRSVLNSVERDLRQKYGRDYRIVKAESGVQALEVLQQLRGRNDIVRSRTSRLMPASSTNCGRT